MKPTSWLYSYVYNEIYLLTPISASIDLNGPSDQLITLRCSHFQFCVIYILTSGACFRHFLKPRNIANVRPTPTSISVVLSEPCAQGLRAKQPGPGRSRQTTARHPSRETNIFLGQNVRALARISGRQIYKLAGPKAQEQLSAALGPSALAWQEWPAKFSPADWLIFTINESTDARNKKQTPSTLQKFATFLQNSFLKWKMETGLFPRRNSSKIQCSRLILNGWRPMPLTQLWNEQDNKDLLLFHREAVLVVHGVSESADYFEDIFDVK